MLLVAGVVGKLNFHSSIQEKAFKSGPSKIFGRQHSKFLSRPYHFKFFKCYFKLYVLSNGMTLFSRKRLIKAEKIQEQAFPRTIPFLRTIQEQYFSKSTQKIVRKT